MHASVLAVHEYKFCTVRAIATCLQLIQRKQMTVISHLITLASVTQQLLFAVCKHKYGQSITGVCTCVRVSVRHEDAVLKSPGIR